MWRPALPALLIFATASLCGVATADDTLPAGLVSPVGFVVDGGDLESAQPAQDVRAELQPPDLSRLALNAESAPIGEKLRLSAAFTLDAGAALAPRPRAFEYSDAYRTRAKIHKYASFAMLPLFAAQFAVGQKLYDGNGSDSTRSLHGALAAGTGILFGVNSVTGGWNLYEGRKDPNHKTRRVLHGVLMLIADAGFVATGATAPDDEGEGGVSRSTHRTIALASMGVATVGYLVMLLSH